MKKTKVCVSCKKRKRVNQFYKKSSANDKLQITCKKCVNEYQEKNKLVIRKNSEKRRNEKREELNKKSREYRAVNDPKQYNASYYTKNKKKIAAKRRTKRINDKNS